MKGITAEYLPGLLYLRSPDKGHFGRRLKENGVVPESWNGFLPRSPSLGTYPGDDRVAAMR